MKQLLILFLLIVLIVPSLQAETRVRVVTYNFTEYPGADWPARDPSFRLIIEKLQPDIISANETMDPNSGELFLSGVLGEGWSVSPWIEEVAYEYGLFYKTDMFEIIGVAQTFLAAAGRPIVMWEVAYKLDADAPHLWIVNSHLTSTDNAASRLERLAQCQPLIDSLKASHLNDYLIFSADLSCYSSAEPHYQALMADSLFYDPINRPGAWNNNGDFRDIHTQSTRGGLGGGLDDRFDQNLISKQFAYPSATTWGYFNEPGRYGAFGNDGQHFNMDINATPPENKYGQDVANALWSASEHLPVWIDIFLGYPEAVDDQTAATPQSFDLLTAYPNPFNSTVQINFNLQMVTDARLAVYNLAGREVTVLSEGKLSSGSHSLVWNASNHPGGIYFARLTVDGQSRIVKLVYLK